MESFSGLLLVVGSKREEKKHCNFHYCICQIDELRPMFIQIRFLTQGLELTMRVGSASTLHFRKIPPIFSPSSWNVHNATLEGGHRTNNMTEGWNNRFSKL
ncbi:MULE domain-containing protein, partial [Aphis craccivora]